MYLRGILTDIQYPTGGKTTFEYEQHQYSRQVDTLRTKLDPNLFTNQVAGGLRIKRITSSAAHSNPQAGQKLVTEYYYVTGYKPGVNPATLPSSGILGNQIRYTTSNRVYQGFGGSSNTTYAVTTFSSQSVLPACGNTQGSVIGYSEVVEKSSNGSYTKYLFSNFTPAVDRDNNNLRLDGLHFDDPPVQSLETNKNAVLAYEDFSSREHERGRLLQAADYNANGVCVKRRRTIYASYNASSDYARTVGGRQFSLCVGGYYTVKGISYKFYTYPYLPTTELTTVYSPTGTDGITTTKVYT